jgi:small conductance mechanosensitive channel
MADLHAPEFVRHIARLLQDPIAVAADFGQEAARWLDPLLFIVLVTVVARLVAGLADRAIARVDLPERLGRLSVDPKQVVTFRQFLRSGATYAIYFAAFVYGVSRLGFDPSPFLVGAGGLVAIAIGFGSQGFVQDVVSGLFILVERQYSVGDFVEIGPVSGFVEDVGLRVTRVRDVTGALRMIPNRTVLTVGNYAQGYMDAVVDVFPADAGRLDRVEAVLAEVGTRLDEELDVVLLPPRISRPLPGSPPFVRAVVRILPLQQWAVDRELAGRVRGALEAEGIGLAAPGIRVVYQCDRVAFYNNLNRIKTRWADAPAPRPPDARPA